MTHAVGPGNDREFETLPIFERPPVIEVVLGVEFQPVADLGAVRLVELSARWRSQYPVVHEQIPIPTSPPAGGAGWPFTAMFANIGAPGIRLWLLSEDDSRLLQIQRDRLILNWRHNSADLPYPHYDSLRPDFVRALGDLTTYLADQQMAALVPTAVEVSYVNEVVTDRESQGLASILRGVSDYEQHAGPPLAARVLSVHSARSLPGSAATLTLTADSEGRGTNRPLITLTYRAALPSNPTEENVMATMDLGHREVVLSFAEATTEAMHKAWGLQS